MEESVKKSKQKVYISIFVMVAVIGCLIYFLAIPIAKKVYKTKDLFEEQKFQYEALRKDTSSAKKYSELVDSLGEGQELVENAVVREDSVVNFIREIESIAKIVGNSVEISHKEVAKSKKKAPTSSVGTPDEEKTEEQTGNAEAIRLLLKVNGNYRNFLEFYYRLENMTYVFNIESFVISSARRTSGLITNKDTPPDYIESTIEISFIPKK